MTHNVRIAKHLDNTESDQQHGFHLVGFSFTFFLLSVQNVDSTVLQILQRQAGRKQLHCAEPKSMLDFMKAPWSHPVTEHDLLSK